MTSTGTKDADKYRSLIEQDANKNINWRFGALPNYDVVNKLFEQGRTMIWAHGSLEEQVQNLVKNWEMEFFHKACIDDLTTMDPNKFTFSLNGREPINLEAIGKLGGGYNPLLQTSIPETLRCYNPAEETGESSHRAFTTTFPRGFAIEIVHVYSGPPLLVFKFRHWGFMEGPFKGHAPTGEIVELYGMAIFQLDEGEKIVKVEFFYDPAELLGPLVKGVRLDGSAEMATSSCPVLRSTG